MKAQFVYQRLNETYESSKELKRVVDLLMKNRKKLDNPHKLKTLFKKQIKNFPILRKFLESEVGIVFHPGVPYPMFSFPPYDIKDKDKRKLFPYLTEEKYPWGIVIINNREEALLHELQHAYDYFRSNRKIANEKKFTSFLKMGGFKEDDTSQLQRYIRLKPEQSAYFTEIFEIVKKYEKEHTNGKLNTRDAFEIFSEAFPRWEYLPTKDKKNFARKFSQHWEKHKEESK